jgi:putative copper resistance protein D
VLLGSIAFALAVDASRTRAVILVAALATAATALATTAVTGVLLITSLGLRVGDIASAAFAVAGATRLLAALVIAGLALRVAPRSRAGLAYVVPAVIVLGAAVADTHAAARIGDAALLFVATAAHELGAGIWLGGLPCFWYAMRHADATRAQAIGRRFSIVAACGVALIVAGAAVFAVAYIGSIEGAYATAYGAMAATKGILLAMLLALGAANYRVVHRVHGNVARVVRFVEIEMALGLAALLAAA